MKTNIMKTQIIRINKKYNKLAIPLKKPKLSRY
jgi:hypothetical protein